MPVPLSRPPSRKYEADGGPGLRAILDLLRGSDEPEQDRLTFLRANIVFWLLGATDGHAKNFSVALSPGARFRLTPLYDVLSAQPSADDGHIRRNQMKLAMAVGGNRHYVVDSIVPRHFEQTAAAAGIPAASLERIFDELRDHAPPPLSRSCNHCHQIFPQASLMPSATASKSGSVPLPRNEKLADLVLKLLDEEIGDEDRTKRLVRWQIGQMIGQNG